MSKIAERCIEPKRTFKCKIGLHNWVPVSQSRGVSICSRCNLLDDGYVKRVARVKKDGAVL